MRQCETIWIHLRTISTGWPRHGMDTLTRRILTRHDTEIIDTIDIDTPSHATFRTWHAKNNMTRQKSGTKFLNIFFTHVPTSWGHVKKSRTKFLKIFFTHVPTSWRHVKNICPSSAKSICYFSVCHWVVSQGSGCSGHSAYLSIQKEQGRGGGRSSLSLGWLLNGKQKNSIYSWQRTGIYF